MIQPPPLRDLGLYPATTALIASAVGVSLLSWNKLGFDPFVMDLRDWHGQPWRLLVSALPHIDIIHLLFNLSWVWVFGTIIERILGWKALVGVTIFFAATSAAAEFALFKGGVGLSGVVYGFFGLLWVLSHHDRRFVGTIDRQTVVLLVAWFVLCCVLTAAGVWRVGNAAHGGGAVVGVLLGLSITSSSKSRPVARVALTVVTVALAVGATAGRPYVNLAPPSDEDTAYLAYLDLTAGRDEEAVKKYELAIKRDPTRADCWSNMGAALHRLERTKECVEAYQTAARLEPSNEQYKRMAAGMTAFLAYEKQVAGEHQEAAALYRQSLAIDDRSASHWFNLGTVCALLGEVDAAREAMQRAVAIDGTNETYRAALHSLPLNFNVN